MEQTANIRTYVTDLIISEYLIFSQFIYKLIALLIMFFIIFIDIQGFCLFDIVIIIYWLLFCNIFLIIMYYYSNIYIIE